MTIGWPRAEIGSCGSWMVCWHSSLPGWFFGARLGPCLLDLLLELKGGKPNVFLCP